MLGKRSASPLLLLPLSKPAFVSVAGDHTHAFERYQHSP